MLGRNWCNAKNLFSSYSLIPLLPFYLETKYLKKIYGWDHNWIYSILIWSINVIQMYDYHIYSDLFRKLITLSKNNTFTNPFIIIYGIYR